MLICWNVWAGGVHTRDVMRFMQFPADPCVPMRKRTRPAFDQVGIIRITKGVKNLKGKVVFVLLDGFADWEGAPLAAALTQPEGEYQAFDVLYASDRKEPRRSIGGLTVLPDISLAEIPPDARALVLIGGTSWRKPEAEAVVPIVARFLAEDKAVGAICDAARFLGAHGLLNGHRHTANFLREMADEAKYLNAAGFVAEDCVRDRNLVTANGQAPYLFGREMLLALGVSAADAAMWYDMGTMGLRAALKKYWPEVD